MMEGIRVIGFDLDGTVTQHRGKLEEENRRVLEALSRRYRLVMVGAGTCERIWRQLGCYPIDIIGNYGMQFSVCQGGEMRLVRDERVPVDRERQLARAKELREHFSLYDFTGDSLEFHPTGALTFPVLGTKAPIGRKLAYDPDGSRRRAMLPYVRALFSDYRVLLGGTNSFDIIPRRFGKLSGLRDYLGLHGLTEQEAAFCGDDYLEGGNDHDVYESAVRFIPVDDYRQLGPLLEKQGLL